LADDAVYGNQSGCGPIESATDSRIRLLPSEIQFWETTCALPSEVDYSGAQMTLSCRGEGEEWTLDVSLRKDDDVIHFESEGRTEDVRRCD
jgi:hypothetical protein